MFTADGGNVFCRATTCMTGSNNYILVKRPKNLENAIIILLSTRFGVRSIPANVPYLVTVFSHQKPLVRHGATTRSVGSASVRHIKRCRHYHTIVCLLAPRADRHAKAEAGQHRMVDGPRQEESQPPAQWLHVLWKHAGNARSTP